MNNKMAINTYQQLNLKKKTNKQNRNRIADTENVLTVDRREGGWARVKKVQG